MKKILISGGTGLIGSSLAKLLKSSGYEVAILTRRKGASEYSNFLWNIEDNFIEEEAFKGTQIIIHLAGTNIGKRSWTPEVKQEILQSRTKSAQLIFNYSKNCGKSLETFISASAIGYYGAVTSDKIFSEDEPPAKDFLGSTCKLWEESADKFKELSLRVVKIRTAPVIAKKGGIIDKLLLPIKLGLGSPVGSGRQYMPVIHIDDICNIYKFAVTNDIEGAFNASAPEQLTNREVLRTIAKKLHRPFIFPSVPSFAMKIIFGEMAKIILEGSRVSTTKIVSKGFRFSFDKVDKMLENILHT